jgi:protein-S-isoprenylcysteine O-methyltransferase Ste14
MGMFLRQLFAIVALPIMVAVAVPVWIARTYDVAFSNPETLGAAFWLGIGALLFTVGLTLFSACLYYFWSKGRGTLAPWDPPRRFVVEWPYRFVRNPMISGVIFILFGEASALRSPAHATWAGAFLVLNAIYIPTFEEPQLAARFGDPYREYTRRVRRFVPRWTRGSPEALDPDGGSVRPPANR